MINLINIFCALIVLIGILLSKKLLEIYFEDLEN